MSEADSEENIILVGGRAHYLDQAGYLLDAACWSRAFAETMASRENLLLLSAHWQLIEFARDFYNRYDESPPMRALVKWLGQQQGEKVGNSRYLYQLFPDGPGKQLSLLAGLPRPVSCI